MWEFTSKKIQIFMMFQKLIILAFLCNEHSLRIIKIVQITNFNYIYILLIDNLHMHLMGLESRTSPFTPFL